MKSVQIRSFTGKYGPEEVPYLDTFHVAFRVNDSADKCLSQLTDMILNGALITIIMIIAIIILIIPIFIHLIPSTIQIATTKIAT